MNLAQQIMNKYKTQRFPLYFEEMDFTIYVQGLNVGDLQRIEKVAQAKQALQIFLYCAFDDDGKSVASNEEDVQGLPELVVGLVSAVAQQMTQGAGHDTCHKVVEHYLNSVNITDDKDVEALEADIIEETPTVKKG